MAPLFDWSYDKATTKEGYVMQIIVAGIGILVVAVLVYLGWTLMKEE